MCLIAVAWHAHPHYPLVLAANRDEYHARPAAPLARWPAPCDIIAGRDLQAGGSWLGVTTGGRFCAVTNYREPDAPRGHLSRGKLVTDCLDTGASLADHFAELAGDAKGYSGFNLIAGDARGLFCFGNRGPGAVQTLGAGVHGISNGPLGGRWPKTRRLTQALERLITEDRVSDAALLAVLRDDHRPEDAVLPDTGIGIERERWLASVFIQGEIYGTRCSTVLIVRRDGRCEMTERRFNAHGQEIGDSRVDFRLPRGDTPVN